MNAIVETLPRVSLPRIYALESKHEFLRLLRAPAFAVPTLMFPPMFYLLFAVLFVGNRGDYHANVYLLATYGVFGVMAPGLFGFGVSVASALTCATVPSIMPYFWNWNAASLIFVPAPRLT